MDLEPSAKKVFEVVNHVFAAVGGELQNPRVHPDRIFRACLHTKAAEYANTQIDIKMDRIFLDVRILMLLSNNVDASGRTNRLAHHTGNATRTPVFPFDQPVKRSHSRRKGSALFGILVGYRSTIFWLQSN